MSQVRSPLHRAVRLGSVAVTLAALGFVAQRVVASAGWGLPRLIQPAGLATLAGGIVAYAVIQLFLSSAWRRLLLWLGEARMSATLCHSIYGRSQIGKYLPGNVFHFAGRQYLAMQAGMAPGRVAASVAYEIAGLIAAGAGITLAGYPLYAASNPWISAASALALVLAMLALPLALPALRDRWPALRQFRSPGTTLRGTLASWLPVYGFYLAFLLALGVLLLGLIVSLTGAWPGTSSVLVIAAFAPAWLAGFLTPGAPSGVGVREAVLIFLLGPLLGEPEITLAALALRVVTLFGDVLFYGLGRLLAMRPGGSSQKTARTPSS